ncbi:MAG: sugar phosphate isomerase/epimerase family protein [Armatimonadota bacterium]
MKACINGATTMPYSLEEDIRAAGRAGFDEVEIWASKLDDYLKFHSTDDLKALLDDCRVRPATICPCGMTLFGDVDGALAQLDRAARIAQEIGCPTLLVCPDAPPAGMSEQEAFSAAGSAARRHAETAGRYGVKVAIEPLGMHTFVPGPRQALRIIEEAGHPSLGLMMDTFHYYKSGVPLDDIRAIPTELLLIVHINDCEDRPREELNDGHRLYLGEGILPLVDEIRILREKGYEGALSVEIFRQEYWQNPIDEIAVRSMESLRRLLKSSGVS